MLKNFKGNRQVTSSSTLSTKLYVASNSASSCEYHRIVLPFRNLGELNLRVPVLWFNRTFRHGIEKVISAKERGAKIVMDLDDMFRLEEDHYLFHAWKSFGVTEQIIDHLKLADVVMVTNTVLADLVKGVNPNIVIVPNALPYDQDQFTRSTRDDDTRLIYVAGPSHASDAKILDFGGELTVAGLKVDGCEFKETVPTVRYMALYDGHLAAVAPLVSNTFNRCKSNLKLLEAGAKGLPLFASAVHPYKNDRDTVTILMKEDESWKKRLSKYSDEGLKELGEITAEHVRTHYHLNDSNQIRRQVFESFS